MKKYRLLIYSPFYLLLNIYQPARAGIWEWGYIKKKFVGRIPFIGDTLEVISDYRLESKVGRVNTTQRDGVAQLRELARKAIQAKEKVEKMYYFEE